VEEVFRALKKKKIYREKESNTTVSKYSESKNPASEVLEVKNKNKGHCIYSINCGI